MAKIFISYRRVGTARSVSGRIYEHLVKWFGKSNVFKDVDDIPAGVNFGSYIQQSVRECAVMLVVIGPHWLDAHGSESFWGGSLRVSVTFAVKRVPDAWLASLGEGGVLVAPVGPPNGEQALVSFTKRHGEIYRENMGAVRYVPDRSSPLD